MSLTRIAFWSMLAVAAIEIYELVRFRDASAASAVMLALSLGAAGWLYLGERNDAAGS